MEEKIKAIKAKYPFASEFAIKLLLRLVDKYDESKELH